eukprot:6462110-Pyramimonas_sp.AAC.2
MPGRRVAILGPLGGILGHVGGLGARLSAVSDHCWFPDRALAALLALPPLQHSGRRDAGASRTPQPCL